MDQSIPAGAAILLDFIRKTEVGTTDRSGYDVIYAFKQDRLPKPITEMTLLEVQQGQYTRWNGLVVSSATGGYQFMYRTLGDLIEQLKLDINARLTPDLQDRLGFALLERRKYREWMAGIYSNTAFGKQLAQEWASLPVLEGVQGAHQWVKRGQSYYAGDALNKALVAPETVEDILWKAKQAGDKPPVVTPPPVTPPPPVDGLSPQEIIAEIEALLEELKGKV